MQGIIDYYGDDAVCALLVNDSGDERAKAADEYIERYGMDEYPRVRMETEACGRKLLSELGQFGWGYVVVGADGKLHGVNLHSTELEAAVASGLGIDPDEEEPFHATARVIDRKGGSLFNLSERMKKPLHATVEVTLTLPEGWYVRGAVAPDAVPTSVEVGYPGCFEFGEAKLPSGTPAPGGGERLFGPVRITVPMTVPKGTPIGKFLIHGTVRAMACNADRCLPPMEIPWKTWIDIR